MLSLDQKGRAIPSALSKTSEVQRTGPTSTSEGLDEDEPSQDEKEEETSSSAASEESDDEEEKNSQADKAPAEMEEVDKIRTELSTQLMQSEKRAHGGDSRITGDLETNGNTYAMNIMDEIRSISTTVSCPSSNSSSDDDKCDSSSCRGKYIYVYDLPPEFNVELAKRCDSLVPWFGFCDFFTNSGIGKPVPLATSNGSQILLPAGRWFNTHQYALELVLHARVLKYKCLTDDPNMASLFYIPYYGGLDVIRWHWALNATNEKRDALGRKLVKWLEKQPSWIRREGLDHVFVLGKISWDFRRPSASDWGSRLLEFVEMQEVTKLLIERNLWHRNDIGVPHPTFFHPKSAADIRSWLAHVESQERNSLVSFVGKDRHLDPNNVRSALIGQCRNATARDCHFLECERDMCLQPAYVTEVFLTSHFCMQPPGDSPTRRSVFDSLIAGCIPVLLHPCTAYLQYPWHLPRNMSSWSVYISKEDAKVGSVNVVEVLKKISKKERVDMRKLIIQEIVPGLLYAEPGADVSPFKDAFDVIIENLLYRTTHLPDLEQIVQNSSPRLPTLTLHCTLLA